MNLYQISNEYQSAFKDMQSMDLDNETIEDSLAAIKGEFQDKAIACVKWEKGIEGKVQAIDVEIKRLQEMKKVTVKQRDSFREYIRSSMDATGIDKIEHSLFTITLRKAVQVAEVLDQELLPKEFLTIVPESVRPDKKSILAELKIGDVPGARLAEGKRGLMIK